MNRKREVPLMAVVEVERVSLGGGMAFSLLEDNGLVSHPPPTGRSGTYGDMK